jgi:hypothetical protein
MHPAMKPLASPGHWVLDPRGEGRGVRVSAHVEAGFLVLSTWKSDRCVGTVRLLPEEAAALVAGIADGLSLLATASHQEQSSVEQRLTMLDGRVAEVAGRPEREL